MMTEATVVIPTYNFSKTLPATLRSLEGLDYDRDKFEVIVVDDGSTDAVPDILKEFQAGTRLRFSWFRRDRSRSFGPGPARNVGITHAAGRVIAFTDADCLVDQGWLKAVFQAVVGAGHAVIGGAISTDDLMIFPWRLAPAGHIGVTANLAYDTAQVGKVYFNESFQGYVGQDFDLVLRLEKMGHPLHMIPEAKIVHPPNTFTRKAVVRRALARKNEILLHKLYGDRVFEAIHPVFRPLIFRRISPATAVVLSSAIAAVVLLAFDWRRGLLIIGSAAVAAAAVFLGYFYRYCLLNRTAGARLSVQDRCKTLLMLVMYFPVFVWSRIAGSIEFRHFML